MAKKKSDETVTVGSANVFADLGLPNPDLLQAKAELVRQIAGIIRRRRMPHARAAKALGITVPKLQLLLAGRLGGFSMDRLLKFLALLDQDVRINIRPKAKTRPFGTIAVARRA